MYTMEDILARLNAGATPDEIANEFVDALNSAVQEQEATAQKAAEAARIKLADATDLRNAFTSYVAKYHPALAEAADGFEKFTAEDIVDAFDRAEKELMPILELGKKLQEAEKRAKANKPEKTATDPALDAHGAAKDPIAEFLKAQGLL